MQGGRFVKGDGASPARMAELRAMRQGSPWGKKPKFCGFRKSSRRCFGRQSGKRSSPKCKVSRVSGRCRKVASARRNHKSAVPAHSRSAAQLAALARGRATAAANRAARKAQN